MKNAVIALARRALPLMNATHRHEAESIIARFEREGNDGADLFADYRRRAGAAFAGDLQPVATALAAALHAISGAAVVDRANSGALIGLRALLPGLLREVNKRRGFQEVLTVAMAHAFFTMFHAETGTSPMRTANADEAQVGRVLFSEEPVVTAAMDQWRSRSVFETDLSSAELRGFSQQLRNRSIFSARTTNAEYLAKIAETVDEILAGRINLPEGRIRLMRKLKELGYDPAIGFPGDMAAIPPAERESLRDLSSEMRIDLVLETNVRMAQGYAQVLAGNSEQMRYSYPAYELVRLYLRHTPRGSVESKTVGWEVRWHDAAESVGWEGVSRIAFETGRLIALKDSPIWQALGDGVGGYIDTLLNPFPPFAFRSGKAWKVVPRAEAIALQLIADEALPGATAATLTPGQKEIVKIVDDMPADLRAELEKELGL